RHAGVRAPRGPMVAGYDGGARSDLRFHRRLVQRPTAAFLDRLCLAGRFRTRAGGTHDRGGRGDGRTERVPPRVNHETPNQPVHEIGASSIRGSGMRDEGFDGYNDLVDAIDHAVDLERGYERRFASRREYRWRVWALLTRRVFQKYVPESGTVLELGCGWGEFINQVRAGRKLAMDLNPSNAARLEAGIEFLHQDCSRPWPLPHDNLDVVFTSNFFEHLPHKPALGPTPRQAHPFLP